MSNNIQDPEKKRINAWYGVQWMLIMGVVVVGFISIHKTFETNNWQNLNTWLTRFGCGILIGGASLCAGGLMGFIFGIPSLNQNRQDTISVKYNDNLIKISEWLTTTIVGVGLTQLNKIPHKIFLLGEFLRSSFGEDDWGKNAALAIVFYFLILGFLGIYYWTRTDFTVIIKATDDDLSKKLGEVEEKVSEIKNRTDIQDKTLKISQLETKREQFIKQKDRIITNESKAEFKEILTKAQPGPITFFDDCQKNRWGGKLENNGYKFNAAYIKNEMYEGSYTVVLTITSVITESPLEGKVYFFLHDSYYPNAVRVCDASNNQASISIESYEAFTIGAICNNGNTKLEIDLNLDPNCPPDYKYEEELQTITDIESELNKLKNN